MNAFGNSLPNTGGTHNGVQREQTMEEILASIRKIIESNEAIINPLDGNFSDANSINANLMDANFLDDDSDNEIADDYNSGRASEAVHSTAPASQQPLVQPLAQPLQIEVPAHVAPAVQAVVQPVEAPIPSLQSEMARLVSQSPERRVAAAFDDLNSAFVKAKQMPMADVAEAMLRPMMQDWLDNNLPNLVERLVREEIARIARGDI
jgi:uncharacterized protein